MTESTAGIPACEERIKKRADLTEGRPGRSLLLFAIPMILGNLFQQFYNIADSMIAGKFAGESALGAVGAMYFLALNTPMTDVTMALERLHVPHLMVELMELIYRFIFVLTETASRIRLAQESRLGYQGLRRSLSSLGTLASMVFLRAWRKADRVYTALESRGYSGSLVTLSGDYARGAWLYPLTAAVAAVQLAAWYFERRVMG